MLYVIIIIIIIYYYYYCSVAKEQMFLMPVSNLKFVERANTASVAVNFQLQ